MNYFAPRTCIEIPEIDSHDDRYLSTPLEKFRNDSCYVLLAPPGAGKTETFRKEAEQEEGLYVTAREFINIPDRTEWHGTTLFIDGLDEMRAGASDQRTHFDQIRAKLQDLGCPRFRLSCREADWFGANDRNHLKNVSPDRKLKVLRLDPLSDEDILNILCYNHNVETPEQFIVSAREKEIYGLLINPQSLGMLASAVTDGNWPETRTETFDLACRKLLEEHNEEHQLADPDAVGIQELLDMTGKLCAIQLLSGHAGYILISNEEDCGYINLKQIHAEEQRSLRKVLRSKLFESQDEPRIAPVHRQVAEFLGGLYLAKLIQEGLPVRRILALMTGYDGGIVSELRGLSAWLAVHSPESRKEIIARDPLGVILYGDIRSLSAEEKYKILRHIANETKKNPWYTQVIGYDSHLEYLATPDMREYIQNILTEPTRNSTQQSLVNFLLEVLQHGSSIPELGDALLKIVRDDSWPPNVRDNALRAFIQQGKNGNHSVTQMTNLLEDVNAGSVSDPNDQLLGILLKELYPDILSSSDIWEYFRAPKAPNLSGNYRLFWLRYILEQTTTTQLAELLDGLYGCSDSFFADYGTEKKQFSFFSAVFPAWLARFLAMAEEQVPLDRFSSWLWIVSDRQIVDWDSHKMEIRSWLNDHPEMQKAVFEEWMKPDDVNPYEIDRRLFRDRGLECTPPQDFGLWCLKHAIVSTDENFKKFFLRTAANAIENNIFNKGLSQEVIEETLADKPDLKQLLLASQSSYRNISRQQENFAEEQKAREQQELLKRINYLKSHKETLSENRCSPRLLHDLARVYFGEDVNFPSDKPVDLLHDFLGGNEDLIETTLKAFQESLIRSDIPDEAEIIQLREDNKAHYLALPFLAGMEEIFRNNPEFEEIPIEERQLRQAIAFYYNAPLPTSLLNSHPLWYQKLLVSNPDIVSDVLISCALSRMRKSKETLSNLYRLAFRDDYAKAANLATLQLLKKFPVRCVKQQLPGLNYLLRAALLHRDEEPFLKLVNRKLSYRSMNIAQHVYWLTAGLIVSPSSFIEKLETYLTGRERRVKNLLECIKEFPDKLIKRLDVPVLEFLIRTIGHSSPFTWLSPEDALGLLFKYRLVEASDKPKLSDPEESGWVSPSTEAANLVHRLIQQLASIQSPSATDALERLSSDDELLSWRQYLTEALRTQKSTRREASFSHFSVNQVLETLDNKNPANAADLSALTIDILTDLARNIRDGNTSDWRQYWDMDTENKPAKPRIEDFCRDTLLSDLRIKLNPLGIDPQPEGRYADDKRSDIRIAYKAMCNIPIEIKRSNNQDLWSAIKSQLIAKYTRDPETDGYGIYLVFWFGKELYRPPGSGTRPQSAMELKERLINSLTTDEQRKISVCVIDVAKS